MKRKELSLILDQLSGQQKMKYILIGAGENEDADNGDGKIASVICGNLSGMEISEIISIALHADKDQNVVPFISASIFEYLERYPAIGIAMCRSYLESIRADVGMQLEVDRILIELGIKKQE